MKNEYWTQIESIKPIAKETFEVTFVCTTDPFIFSPGQYVWVVLPKLNFPDPRGERRAFSITTGTQVTNKFSIQFRNTGSGYKKTLLSLQPGEKVQILGPFGSSYEPSDKYSNIVLVAGGNGIAPFMSILRSLESTKATIPIKYTLIYMNSSPEKGMYYDELQQLTSANNIPFINHIGSFRENILPSAINFEKDTFFICGPVGMVDEVYKVLSAKGVVFGNMHFEEFYPTPSENLKEEDFLVKLGERNIMLQAVQDSRNHVIVVDANGKIIFANKMAEKNTGFNFDEMRGNTPRLWGGLMKGEFYRHFWFQKKQDGGFDGQIINRRKDGQNYTVILHVSPIYGSQKQVIGFIGTEEDITQIVTLEKKLAEEKGRDDALLLSLGEGVVAANKNGEVTFLNKAAELMLGYTNAEVMGKLFEDVIVAESLEGKQLEKTERPHFKAAKLTSTSVEQVVYVRKNGTRFIAQVTVSPIYLQDSYDGSEMIIRDISKEKEIDKAKTEFVSIASHQLRTPLGITKWSLESIKDHDYLKNAPEGIRNTLDDIYKSNERVLELVRNLLSVSRIDQGRVKDNPEETDVLKMLVDLTREMEILANQKGIKLSLVMKTENLPNMMIDSLRFHEVVMNLINNALQYTPSGGSIEVGVNKDSSGLIISVKDTGIGISSEDQKRLFAKFARLDNGVAANPNGSGLGLYLVKSYVEAWGGNVLLESKVGEGSTFTITIPINAVKQAINSQISNEQKGGN